MPFGAPISSGSGEGVTARVTFKLQVGGAIKGRALAVLLIARVFTASRNSLRPVYLTVHHQITT
jgi:hypothetical protein